MEIMPDTPIGGKIQSPAHCPQDDSEHHKLNQEWRCSKLEVTPAKARELERMLGCALR